MTELLAIIRTREYEDIYKKTERLKVFFTIQGIILKAKNY